MSKPFKNRLSALSRIIQWGYVASPQNSREKANRGAHYQNTASFNNPSNLIENVSWVLQMLQYVAAYNNVERPRFELAKITLADIFEQDLSIPTLKGFISFIRQYVYTVKFGLCPLSSRIKYHHAIVTAYIENPDRPSLSQILFFYELGRQQISRLVEREPIRRLLHTEGKISFRTE